MYDTEPDVFTYNIPGYSGKFIFDATGAIRLLPYTPIQIKPQYAAPMGSCAYNIPAGELTGFVITTAEGVSYSFTVLEHTDNYLWGMGLDGDELSEAAWEKLFLQLAGKVGDVGRTAADNRLFLNAVLWVMRHGGTWRVLPERFGKHDTVRKRALRWAQKGTWQRLVAAVRLPEVEAVLLDSTIMRAHQRASGQVKKSARATKPSGAAGAG